MSFNQAILHIMKLNISLSIILVSNFISIKLFLRNQLHLNRSFMFEINTSFINIHNCLKNMYITSSLGNIFYSLDKSFIALGLAPLGISPKYSTHCILVECHDIITIAFDSRSFLESILVLHLLLLYISPLKNNVLAQML